MTTTHTQLADPNREHDELAADVGRLKSKVTTLLRGRAALASVIHNHVIAMQAALIEAWAGRGDQSGITWIRNTLMGPGFVPDCDEALELSDGNRERAAQAWFDAENAKERTRLAALAPENAWIDAEVSAEPATPREIMAAAAHLAHLARESGFVLNITQEARRPLVMGNHRDRIEVFKSLSLVRSEEAAARQSASAGQ